MRRFSSFYLCLMALFGLFPFLPWFTVGDGSGGGGAGATGGTGGTGPGGSDPANKTGAGNGGQPGAAAVDVQAEINKALKKQADEFAERFKTATGHASLEDFQTEKAKAKGEEQQLLDQRTAELAQTRAELDRTRIDNALLGVSADAVDPGVIQQLLSGKGKVENGVVTIDGKPPAEAVKALLAEKPYLAKAGPSGSGTPGMSASTSVNPWKKDTLNLTEQGRITRENPELAKQLKAQAG